MFTDPPSLSVRVATRARAAGQGVTLWFTGLSGAGKTTLANLVACELQARNERVEILDGDDIRASISKDLGFDKSDRDRNVRILSYIASLLSKHGVIVLVAAISPYGALRKEARDSQSTPFIEVFVDADLDTLVRRDVKGLYARAIRGDLKNFSGISDPYEPPVSAEIHLRTDISSVNHCVTKILNYLEAQRLIGRNDFEPKVNLPVV